MRIEKGDGWELRLGRWQDVLVDLEVGSVDAVIGDPPYSKATHEGQRGCRTSGFLGSTEHSGIEYGHVKDEDIVEIVEFVSSVTRKWVVLFGDDYTTICFRYYLKDAGFYSFHAIPWVKTDAAPRILGDGPSPQHELIAIARPRRKLERREKRFRPGWYKGRSASRGATFPTLVGRKPLYLMRALIRDYSEPGDLIVDPFAGSGTTLLAAAIEGRRAIGAEMDEARFELAAKRLKAGYTPAFF
jgi:site-specific DNA-methyltransferase (adenine-specific)